MTMENNAPVPPALSPSTLIAQVPPIAKLIEASSVPKLSVSIATTNKKTSREENVEEDAAEEVNISLIKIYIFLSGKCFNYLLNSLLEKHFPFNYNYQEVKHYNYNARVMIPCLL